jgi:hypothetical protein
VAPNIVVTARHCVSVPSSGAFGCDANGNLLPGSTGGKLLSDLTADELYIFKGPARPPFEDGGAHRDARGKQIYHNSIDVVCASDVAVIVTDVAIPGITPAAMRLDGQVQVGDKVTAVGFGLDATGQEPALRQQRKNVEVLRVGPADATSTLPPVSKNAFEVGESICQGDSGGPAFDPVSGALIGVVSAGGNDRAGTTNNPADGCIGQDTLNYYMELSAFKDVVMTAFQATGQTPQLENQPAPQLKSIGETCTDPSQCQGGVCGAGGDGGQICSQVCSPSAACPSGYACSISNGAGVCNAMSGVGHEGKVGCSVRGPVPDRTRPSGLLAFGAVLSLAGLARLRRRRSAQ